MRYFHVASELARESITVHGLDHTQGESAYEGIDYRTGNYLFTDEAAAYAYQAIREEEELTEYGMQASAYDVWAVEVEVQVQADEFADDESGLGAYSVVTAEAIPAGALTRLD